jgi:hypothetical protein
MSERERNLGSGNLFKAAKLKLRSLGRAGIIASAVLPNNKTEYTMIVD